ncbi:hypothetical protein GJ744_003112 [Endocarpon pusillum]|uniref:Uncharacterized protein n=1 Tax=Endocarpon pusillum TaxID=364733 RepID=A0A8H7AQU9_9EURO|nr:hypothetical protein GJ744_003112 [Endocarpon pusillum]
MWTTRFLKRHPEYIIKKRKPLSILQKLTHNKEAIWPARIMPPRGAGWEPDSFMESQLNNPTVFGVSITYDRSSNGKQTA